MIREDQSSKWVKEKVPTGFPRGTFFSYLCFFAAEHKAFRRCFMLRRRESLCSAAHCRVLYAAVDRPDLVPVIQRLRARTGIRRRR